VEEEKHQNRKKIKTLASRLRETSEQENSLKESAETTEKIFTNSDVSQKNFHNIFIAIESTSLLTLKNSLYDYAVRYSRLRVDQVLSDNEQRKIIDEERTRAHNAFIDACNILSRNMIKNAEDANWRKQLGNDRKVIGDFACYINYILGLKAR